MNLSEKLEIAHALKELGVSRIVAWSGPGALSTRFRIGQFVLPADLIGTMIFGVAIILRLAAVVRPGVGEGVCSMSRKVGVAGPAPKFCGSPFSVVRKAPCPSKFSNAKPIGSAPGGTSTGSRCSTG